LRERIVEKAIALQTCARWARDRFRIETQLKMFFFSALSFGEGGFDLAASHGGRATGLPLFFGRAALFDRGKGSRLRGIRVAAHPFIIPTVKELHVDIELIENPRH